MSDQFGASSALWRRYGAFLLHFGVYSGHLGQSQARFGPSWGSLGVPWGSLGPLPKVLGAQRVRTLSGPGAGTPKPPGPPAPLYDRYTFMEPPHVEGEAKAKQKQSEGTARAKHKQSGGKACQSKRQQKQSQGPKMDHFWGHLGVILRPGHLWAILGHLGGILGPRAF